MKKQKKELPQCKFVLNTGKQCSKQGLLQGYCVRHWEKVNGKDRFSALTRKRREEEQNRRKLELER